jgi:hypothetical protein
MQPARWARMAADVNVKGEDEHSGACWGAGVQAGVVPWCLGPNLGKSVSLSWVLDLEVFMILCCRI